MNEKQSHLIIVSRHQGLVEWLASHGITGQVITHVTDINDIKNKHVIGVLPLHLASQCSTITTIDMNLPPDKRGVDLSPTEMDHYNATMNTYQVTKINDHD